MTVVARVCRAARSALCIGRGVISNRPRRLPGVSYVGYQRYFLTTCTAQRHRAFERADIAQSCMLQLRRSAAAHAFALAAYCFMLDHVHVLAYGTAEDADLQEFVVHFKKLTAFEYARLMGKRLWQPGYYDRVLRDDESTEAIARYVLENPIRAGLARSVGEYPFAGSDLYDARAILSAWE